MRGYGMPDVGQLFASPEVIVNETELGDGLISSLMAAPAVITRVSGGVTSRIVEHEGSTWRVECLMDMHQATVHGAVEVQKTGAGNELEDYT